jgi:hypothetical protein
MSAACDRPRSGRLQVGDVDFAAGCLHAVSADMSAAIDRLSGNRRETP